MPENFQVSWKRGESLSGRFWPADKPVMNLTVMTGMNEHALRYHDFASYMNGHGVNVWVLDAYGQGLNAFSVERQQEWPEEAFAKTVDAIATMILDARSNGLPTFAMGHSMGSFMMQSVLERYPLAADGVILCGSNGGQSGLMQAGYAMAKLLVNKNNRNKPSPVLQNLGLGGYAKAIANRKTPFDWLSENEENVKAYIRDPYCGHENTGGFWLEFMRGMTTIWNRHFLEKISPEEKILIIGGAEDPVGRNGKGLEWLADTYQKLGIKNTRLLIYPGMRHEILNETGRMQVLQDILTFMKEAAS